MGALHDGPNYENAQVARFWDPSPALQRIPVSGSKPQKWETHFRGFRLAKGGNRLVYFVLLHGITGDMASFGACGLKEGADLSLNRQRLPFFEAFSLAHDLQTPTERSPHANGRVSKRDDPIFGWVLK